MNETVQKVIRDGKVAVLISPGYGAGWSTWADEEQKNRALFDSRLVEAKERGVKDISSIVKEVFGEEESFYEGGWEDVEIRWLPIGTPFEVEEYDGSETLKTTFAMPNIA